MPEDTILTGATTRSIQQSPTEGSTEAAYLAAQSLAVDNTNCPRHFHLRMYGLADYLLMDSLKKAANVAFNELMKPTYATLLWNALEPLIKEIYSTRGNYQQLKKPFIKAVVPANDLQPKDFSTPEPHPEAQLATTPDEGYGPLYDA